MTCLWMKRAGWLGQEMEFNTMFIRDDEPDIKEFQNSDVGTHVGTYERPITGGLTFITTDVQMDYKHDGKSRLK